MGRAIASSGSTRRRHSRSVEPAISLTGISYVGHRDSGVPVYAIAGNVRVHPAESFRVIKHLWPGSQIMAFAPVRIWNEANLSSFQQLAACAIVPNVTAGGPPENSVIIGWSLGVFHAVITEVALETSTHGARAVVLLDNVNLDPIPLKRPRLRQFFSRHGKGRTLQLFRIHRWIEFKAT